MDCAAFENRLTEVLAGELDAALARTALVDLERHAGSCAACAGAAGWVELAALPHAERDPREEPPTGYWRDFNAVVARRAGVAPVSRRGTFARRLAGAAAVVLVLTAGWVLRGRLAPAPEPGALAVVPGPSPSGAWSLLEEAIRDATPEELAAALGNLPSGTWEGFPAIGWRLGDADLNGEWLPDAGELDEIDQEQLLEWLDQLDQAEGRTTS